MKKILLFIVLIGVLIFSCSKSTQTNSSNGGGTTNTVDCTGVAQSFAADVNPIIQSNCALAGCHAAGSSNGPGPLLTYGQIFNARADIRGAVSSGVMPLGSVLSTAQKNSILCWIDSGASSN